MCNLYRLSSSTTEVAGLFKVSDVASGGNRGELVYPGYPGLVVALGELREMSWGFPLTLRSKRTGEPLKPKPVNNARTDKLRSTFWRSSFEQRRCLIPVSAFAEAEGERGKMTRTWLSVAGDETFACAGIWRDSDEWGRVYSMVMTDPSPQTAGVHDRMPVILDPSDYEQWQQGEPEEAIALCRPYDGDMVIECTSEPWVKA